MGIPVVLDLQDVEGGVIAVDDTNGVIVSFGRPMRRFIIKNPSTSAKNVYYTIGKAGMLDGATPKTAAVLKAAYPFLIPGEDLEFEEPNRQPETLELLCAQGDSVPEFRIMKV